MALLFVISDSKITLFYFVTILVDTTDPVISGCPSSQTINVPVGTTQATATWTPPTATDNQDTRLQSTASHTPGSTFGLTPTQVTYTFRDGAGNTATCTFTITVTCKCWDLATPVFRFSDNLFKDVYIILLNIFVLIILTKLA